MSRPRREIALSKAFGPPCVLTLQQLCQMFRCSRTTILRRLAEHGYYASYNHSGKFLTIPEVAHFDSQGIWTWRTARFSKHGTLKDTVAHLVQSSPEGMTHRELAALLAVAVPQQCAATGPRRHDSSRTHRAGLRLSSRSAANKRRTGEAAKGRVSQRPTSVPPASRRLPP